MKRQPGEFDHQCSKCPKRFRNTIPGAYGDMPLCPTCEEAMDPKELRTWRKVERERIKEANRKRRKK